MHTSALRVLLVDDDEETLELVGKALTREGHEVLCARTAEQANQLLAQVPIEILVLDVMLQQGSGLELCAELRQRGNQVPILFLSARGTVNARVEGLEVGGDDYLTKPFAVREVVARVRALGRRRPLTRDMHVSVGSLTLHFAERRAVAHDQQIPITRREWDILRALGNARGRVVAFDELLEQAWGEVTEKGRASLEVIMSRLRRKIDAAAGRPLIRTVRGHGYALELDG
ncbi:MAG TPA: response regulator transcription factor [Polyangiaceae bacterium]|nr:response regulator transcription factor [Polyangiaceae bacterium]